ncbi:MAG: hypothetical protein QOG03_1950, partial [Actinomycetota bacterium]|nr:hypothetical protein [Actinomycetota bacterium]
MLLAVSLVVGFQELSGPSAVPIGHLVDPAHRPGDQAMAPPPDHFDAPPAPSAAPPLALRSPFAHLAPGPGTWAVTIGVNDYPGS